MAKNLTEDEVRDKARGILGFKDQKGVRSGVGQMTTFNQCYHRAIIANYHRVKMTNQHRNKKANAPGTPF